MKVIKAIVAMSILALSCSSLSAQSSQKKDETIKLTADNTIVLNSEVSGESVAEVVAKAKALDEKIRGYRGIKELGRKKAPLYLFLNTPGGSIQAGLELIEALQGIGRPVHTITMFAASMGFQIAQNLGDRTILRNGVLMSHRAAGEIGGSFGGEPPSQMENRFHLWNQRMKEMDEQTVRRSNGKQTLASYQRQYSNEMWVTGQEAVTQGYADRIVTVSCDSSLSGVSHHEAVIMGMIQVSYDLSDCPMLSAPVNVQVKMETNQGLMSDKDFVARGGSFEAICLVGDSAKRLCALDTSLSRQRINALKKDFESQYRARVYQTPTFNFYGTKVTW